MGNDLSGISPPVIKKPKTRLLLCEDGWADGDKARDNIKKPTIQLLLFEDGWADGNDHDKA